MARDFDGSDDKIVLSDISSVGNFTISIWWNHDSSGSGENTIFAFENFPSTPRNTCIIKAENASGDSSLIAILGDTGAVVDITLLSDNVWHHTAMVRSGTTVTPYTDGLAESTITVGSGTFTAENIRIGDHFFSGGENEFYDGLTAEFAMWSVALSAVEITSLSNRFSPLTIRPQSLLRYLPIMGRISPEVELINASNGTLTGTAAAEHTAIIYPHPAVMGFAATAVAGGLSIPVAVYHRKHNFHVS